MPHDLTSVLAPTETAKGLPNAHYISPEIFSAEREKLFFAGWAAIGFAADIPEVGDAKPIDFVGMPLLAVRGKDGEVNVFQNTCRHRGMILVDEPTKVKGPIRCPYHSWCYDLKGKLVSTPHVGGAGVNSHEAIKNDELGLFEIRSHVWFDIIFVNVSGTAETFEKLHAPLLERWSEFDQPFYHGGASNRFSMDVNTNWKLAVENYCESYHLPWIHPGLNSYSRLEDHYHIMDETQYSGQGTEVYRQIAGEAGQRFPDFANLSDKWDEAAEYISLFPNVLLGIHRDHAFAMILMPDGPEKTNEQVSLYYASPEVLKPEWEAMRANNAELWRVVFSEDVGVVEGMQRGRHGVKFDGGKFSPVMDIPTHIFHKWVATQMTLPG